MYSFKSRVRFSETDPSGALSLTALLNYYQDCVIFHTESVGLTIDSLKRDNTAWVLMGWQIDISRMPRLGEEIEVVTNPYRIGGFMGLRNFWMNDAQGQRISLADSMWALIDLTTGKPTQVQPDWAGRYGLGPRVALDWRNTPIRLPEEHDAQAEPVIVHSGMLDTNRHMNNAWYAHVAGELLPDGFDCRRLSIEYKKPAALGDRLYLSHAIGDDDAIITLNDAQGEPYALTRFKR